MVLRRLLKMYVVKRDGRSAYLRAWGEFYVPFSLHSRSRTREDWDTCVEGGQPGGPEQDSPDGSG